MAFRKNTSPSIRLVNNFDPLEIRQINMTHKLIEKN